MKNNKSNNLTLRKNSLAVFGIEIVSASVKRNVRFVRIPGFCEEG